MDRKFLSRAECTAGVHNCKQQSSNLVTLCQAHLIHPISQNGSHLAAQHRTFRSKATWLTASSLNKPDGVRTANPRQARDRCHPVSRAVEALHLVGPLNAAVNYTVPLSLRGSQTEAYLYNTSEAVAFRGRPAPCHMCVG